MPWWFEAIITGFWLKISPVTSQSMRQRNFKIISSVDMYVLVKLYLCFNSINGARKTKNSVKTITEI